MPNADPDLTAHLVERSAELKQRLLEFARGRRYRGALDKALAEEFGDSFAVDEGEVANAFDRFIMQHRLADGRTLLEHFVDKHPELPAAERDMLLGWRDVVEGIFAIQRRDGDALILHNLVDDLTYRARSNAGPGVFAQMPVGSFLMTRLVPVGDDWLLSGAQRVYPKAARLDVYRAAAQLGLMAPRLVFRNPERLEQAWRMQREDRERFVAFFGADTVVLPGRELAERMRAYTRFVMREHRDAEGKTATEHLKETYGKAPTPPELDLPDHLLAAETVGVIYDEIDGMNFFPDFGLVEETFARPELAADRRHREAVRDYLESPGIIPLPLRRLAERDPERASRVFQAVLRKPDFSWERDGEALLRRYKRDYYLEPPVPGVAPLSETLTRAQLSGPIGARVGRNDPCPCGSGKKYKRCCGA